MYTENEFILKINSNRIKDICALAQMTSASALAKMSSASALAQRLRKPLRASQHPKGVLRKPATEARSAEGSSNHSKTLSKGEFKLNKCF